MFQIRTATDADVQPIAAIHVAGWQTAYRGILPDALLDGLRVEARAAQWAQWVAGPGVHTLVAADGPRVLGFVRLGPARPVAEPPPRLAEVSHLYVDREAQGRGAGRALMRQALRIARAEGYLGVVLWVLEENRPARAFYERAGLRADGTRLTDPAFLGNDAVELRYALRFPAAGEPGFPASYEASEDLDRT